ncbi:MAG TPA: EF-P lysine aminoacylase EpmA [Candidatus Bathyarchaeia archaeon]|nr:EF-P lysine aminoacylase EpmA [Candidatus Bathyarchaeia archaeon]
MDWQKLKANPGLWQRFQVRSRIIDRTRRFFKRRHFLEVQTPVLTPRLIPESYLEYFQTELLDKMGRKRLAFLTTSPEMWHKKLLAAGSGNIFEITKSFRNTDIGGHFHNPEFTLLEWYRINTDYGETMADCEELIRFLNHGKAKLEYQGQVVDISKPFEKLSVIEAFSRFAGMAEDELFDEKKFRNTALKKGYRIKDDDDWSIIFELILLKEVEPNLGYKKPALLYNFPSQFAPLAKTSQTDSRVKERFELFLFGIELADAYTELTDPEEQKSRFEEEISLRKKMGKIDCPPDWDFVAALRSGLPPCSGVALGIDRLVMVFTDQISIDEVLLFSGEEIFAS